MKNIVFKVFTISIVTFLLFVYIFPWKNYGMEIPFSGKEYRLGLDLQGGIELDYKVDLDEVKKEEGENFTTDREKEIIENLKKIIDKRIESLGINDSEINDATYGNEKHIIVQIPLKGNDSLENSKNIEMAKKAIGNVVKVSFKELRKGETTEEDLKKRKEIAENIINEINSGENFTIIKDKYKLNFEKILTGTIFTDGKNYLTDDELTEIRKIFTENKKISSNETYKNFEKIFDEKNNLTKEEIKNLIDDSLKKISENREKQEGKKENIIPEEQKLYYSIKNILDDNLNKTFSEFYQTKKENLKEGIINENEVRSIAGYFIFKKIDDKKIDFIFIDKTPSEWINIVSKDGKTLNDKFLLSASVSTDQIGQPVVVLTFNDEGGRIFYEATSRLIGNPIAIFVGGEMVTSPNVNQAISGGQATISGRYTTEEAKLTAENINSGVVPAPIFLTSEKTIDSKIGAEALDKLIIAGVLDFILMLIFLIIFYKLSGFMAFLALVIYAIIVLAIVKMLGMVLTLASIAGLILSIGMAIDANILIFERIKAELKEGKKIKEAIEIGFETSWSAIWDSNITGLLVALILFIFGINMIKGFGAMLAIGIIVSLFTAMIISRIFIRFLANNIKNKNLFIGFKK